MSLEQDIERIAEQERVLQFERFDADLAFQLGGTMRRLLMERDAGASVEIQMAGQILFFGTTRGAVPGQADWLRRKRNTVMRFHRSSYGVGRVLEKEGLTLEAKHGLPFADYVAHGGGFPLILRDVGCVGSIGVSGLPQREDHVVAVEALAQQLGVNVVRLG